MYRIGPRLVGIAMVTVTASGTAQQVRTPGPPTEFPGEFSSIRSLRALGEDRLVVTDAKERQLFLLEIAKGTSTTLARSGAGPKEYKSVSTIQRDKGGGVVVYDPQQLRFLPIGPTGKVMDVRAVPNAPKGVIMMTADGPDVYTLDTVGNIYTTDGGTLLSPRTTRALIRRSSRGATTIAELRLPESRRVDGRQGISMSRVVTFGAQDYWAVAPDGWVAVVRAAPYRVEWFPPSGPPIVGTAIAHQPLPVTERDKQAVRREFAAMMASAAPSATVNGKQVRPPSVEPEFAATKPAATGRVILIDEREQLWVERNQGAGATTALFDVIDRTGAVVDRVALPASSRVVGFDRNAIYATRTDENDVVHLQRFAFP
jgi:hypothetical protein